MSSRKEKGRVIYEANYGAVIKNQQWQTLKSQMQQAGLPLVPKNIVFVARCKRVGRRYPIDSEAIKNTVEIAGRLGDIATGAAIKSVALELKPSLQTDKIYRAFRMYGRKFSILAEYKISDLGEIFYMIFGERRQKRHVKQRPN